MRSCQDRCPLRRWAFTSARRRRFATALALAADLCSLLRDGGCTASTLPNTVERLHRFGRNGTRRSPWDEVECGHHYARSMSSWTVLLALSGQQVGRSSGSLTFNPALAASTDPDKFQCFWSNGTAWGVYRQQRDEAGNWVPEVEVLGGSLDGTTISADGRTWQAAAAGVTA